MPEHDDDNEAEAKAYMARECTVETISGAYAKITLLEAIEALTRSVLAENGGIHLGECIMLGTTVDDRAAIHIVIEHPDNEPEFDESEELPAMSFEGSSKYGPS